MNRVEYHRKMSREDRCYNCQEVIGSIFAFDYCSKSCQKAYTILLDKEKRG